VAGRYGAVQPDAPLGRSHQIQGVPHLLAGRDENQVRPGHGGEAQPAQTLREEGAQLQQQNRLQDAIAKYNQSLQFWPDQKLKEHVASIEGKLRQDQEAEQRKAQAKRLRDEGAGLQQQNRIRRPSASTVRVSRTGLTNNSRIMCGNSNRALRPLRHSRR